MSNTLVVAQYPHVNRYTGWWLEKLKAHPRLRPVLPSQRPSSVDHGVTGNWFGDLVDAVDYEARQMTTLLDAACVGNVLLTDLSFPGVALACVPLLRLRFPKAHVTGIFHAGSYITDDVFSDSIGKRLQEQSAGTLIDRILVASHYHKDKLCTALSLPLSQVVVLNGMPFYPDDVMAALETTTAPRAGALILGRTEQCDALDMPEADRLPHSMPRRALLNTMAGYRLSLHPKVDETFGYLALESAVVGTVPLVPDAFSYREFWPPLLRCANIATMRTKALHLLSDEDAYTAALAASNEVADRSRRFESIFDDIAAQCEGAT